MRITVGCIAALLVLTASGCEKDPRTGMVPVSGRVTINGEPLPGADIVFKPTGTTKGWGSFAQTQDDGRYQLSARRGGEGAFPGLYSVVVSKRVMPDGSDVSPDDRRPPLESPAVQVVPPQFSNFHQTTLTITVPENGGTIDFPLKTQ